MKSLPFFSVIIPVYDRENIVSSSIESVLNQSFKDFEIILIDDKSEDNSLSVLENFSNNYKNITLVKLPINKGRCYARNQGIKHAKAKWICYLDSDDIYIENHLQVLFDLISNNIEYKAFATNQLIDDKPKDYLSNKLKKNIAVLNFEDFIESNPLNPNQVCHINDKKISWSSERLPISEDWLFLRQLSTHFSVLKTNIITNKVIEHSGRSLNTTNIDSFIKWNIFAAEKFVNENSKLNLKYKNRILSYTYILCANIYLKEKEKKKAGALFKKSLYFSKTYSYSLFYKAIIRFLI